MKRQKRLTKRERKDLDKKNGAAQGGQHIHCIACGRHIEPREFAASPPTAHILACQHGSKFPSCTSCTTRSQALLDEHDRTGQAVKTAAAWH
jgi:hypothetical protein